MDPNDGTARPTAEELATREFARYGDELEPGGAGTPPTQKSLID